MEAILSIETHNSWYSVPMLPEPTLAERIDDALTELGISQEDAGAAIGVDQSTVSGWVSGTRPQRRNLPAISHVLGIPMDELVRLGNYRRQSVPAATVDEILADPDLALIAHGMDRMSAARRRVFMQFVREFIVDTNIDPRG